MQTLKRTLNLQGVKMTEITAVPVRSQ